MLGCSLGGRQAIQAADMFPGDFDGLVAGSPAVDFNALYSWRASFFPLTGAVNSSAASFVPSTMWKTTVHDEVLRQCDGIDGVEDGIIEDPTLCQFDPDTMLCGTTTGDSTTACLTEAQVATVRAIFSPYLWENGTQLYPGMNPGSELNSADGLYAGTPWVFSQDWFRYAVYNDPTWDPATYTLADAEFAINANPGNIETYPSTLAELQNRGGKIIMFHGQQDNQISSFNSPRFYEDLRAGMSYSVEQMDDFFRYFRISGMFHCNQGPGAWVFGQAGSASAQGPFDAQHNVLAALVQWVEGGAAPETITGTKFVNDTVASGVDFERSHCKWPFRNTYLGGEADPKDAASWQCVQISEAEEVGTMANAVSNSPVQASGAGVTTGVGMKERLPVILLSLGLMLGLVSV